MSMRDGAIVPLFRELLFEIGGNNVTRTNRRLALESKASRG
jgi:hypothetical protein